MLNTHGDLRYWIRKILNTEDIEYRRHSVWSIDITGNTQCVSNIYIVYSYTVTPCVLNTHDIRYWTHKTFGSNINITENTPCVLNIQCIVYTLYWMYTILFVLNTRDIHVFNTVENIIYSYTVRIGYTQWQSLWSTHTHTHTHTHTQTHTSDIRYAIWLLQAIHRVYWIHTVIFCYIQYSWIYHIFLHRAYWIHTVTFAIKYIRHSDWNMTITGNTQCVLNVRSIRILHTWDIHVAYWIYDMMTTSIRRTHCQHVNTRCQHVTWKSHVFKTESVVHSVEYTLSTYLSIFNTWEIHVTCWQRVRWIPTVTFAIEHSRHSVCNTAYCIWSVISSFSILNWYSSSLGLFYNVPLKRDQGDWDWRLR